MIDVTGGMAQAIARLPQEMQPVLTALMLSMTDLETKAAKDESAIAQQVIDGLAPMVKQAVDGVNTLTLTLDASVQEIVTLARRIDGMSVSVKLGPEPGT